MVRAIPTMLSILLLSCSTPRRTVHADAPQSWFQITFGVGDSDPADWSGSLQVTGGRLATLHSVRFDKDDKLAAAAGTWTCHTRRAAVADPRDWFVGAKHMVPTGAPAPLGAMIPNAIVAGFEATSEVRVHTAQGDFRFDPASPFYVAPQPFLNGRVEVQRVPQVNNLTAGDGFENDQPAINANWLAWIAYRDRKERLIVARTDGSYRRTIAEGEFSHPALAGDYLVVAMRSGDTWKIAFAHTQGGKLGNLEPITTGGPDLFPAAAVDTKGNLWVAYQAFRGGRTRILSRKFNGKAWAPETAVSENTSDAWMPAIAAGPNGAVHFAWDAYDGGVFNVYHRAAGGRVERAEPSARFQANVSIAVDRNGKVWLAWEDADANWGKDTGFLVRDPHGAALYEGRHVRVKGVALLTAERPRLLAGGRGVFLLFRRRNLKMQAVFSPSLQRDRVQQQSLWDYAVMPLDRLDHPVPLPLSNGRNDARADIAALPDGRLLAAWNADGRTFATPYPYVKNDILTAEIAGLNAGPARSQEPAESKPPTAVHTNEPADVARVRAARVRNLLILRGDMHRHTDISFDGDLDGGILDFYRYMIDAANMDYGALTDHHAGDNKEFFWWILQKHAKMFYYPGRFTPLFAYERSLRFPNGHRNLIWSKEGVPALATTPDEEAGKEGAARLYAYLRQSGGLAMSHTTATLMGTDWRDNDSQLEPLVEIYQGDRTSAEYEGAPRAPRGSDPYSQPGGYKPEGFVWNAWAKGYKLGVQSSSDHSSTHISYAVVLAEGHTREDILKAIAARHAYAATDNIILDVRSGDHIQGDIFFDSARPRLEIHIEGTAPIDKVEVVRNNKFVFTNQPGKASVDLRYEDSDPLPAESYYYVRMQQRDGQMAWSSPVWIRR